MGHYASEMSAPVRHDAEEIERRRAEARDSATFRWDLYGQYEEQGVWIRSDEKLACPRCFAIVPALHRIDHDAWHEATS